MPVDSKNPLYTQWQFQWKKCRDAVEGEEAIKGAGQLYLDQLEGQRDYEFQQYQRRALFYGASGRTVLALTGAIMRRPPVIKYPDYESNPDEQDSPHLLDNIGARNEAIELIIKKVVEEVVTTGRVGCYVDADTDGDPEADPYIALYFAENIINWGERNVKGRQVLEFVVLLEDNPIRGAEEDEDGFEWRRKERWRVLQLADIDGPNPHLVVSIYERKDQDEEAGENQQEEQEEFEMIAQYEPKFKGGMPVPYIPFAFINPSSNTTDVEKPPILDLVNVNLSHYRNSADYEHGLHYTALPTAWVAGFDPNSTRLRIGSSVAWVADNPQSKAGFLEFSGQGLKSIADAMTKKERQMAVLGARLLEEQKSDSEAAAAIRLRHSGEDSVLQHIVKSINHGLTQVLEWIADWERQDRNAISVELNNEFNPLGIDPPTMLVLMQMVQMGHASWDTLYFNLKRGNIYPDGLTMEQEKALIEAGMPLPPPGQMTELAGGLKGAGNTSRGAYRGSGLGAGEGADLETAV